MVLGWVKIHELSLHDVLDAGRLVSIAPTRSNLVGGLFNERVAADEPNAVTCIVCPMSHARGREGSYRFVVTLQVRIM